MNVCVRLFAAARQAADCDTLELELPERATVADLREFLSKRLPQLADLFGRAMFAIDQQYAVDADHIFPDAEIACIPPVSGG